MESKLIIGTAQFGMAYGINNVGGQPTAAVIAEILDLALQNGIGVLDSAEAYGNAHQQIGSYHASREKKFKVISKFSPTRKDLPLDIYKRVSLNIEHLNVEALEAYMLHSYADYLSYINEFSPALDSLKKDGKIKQLGVSVYTNSEFEKVISDDRVDLIQIPFNVFDNTTRRGDLIAKAKEKGKTIHARSVYLQGLFFMSEAKFPDKLKPMLPAIEALQLLALKNNCTIETICLQYVLQQPTIDGVLVGVESVSQIKANCDALKIKLPTSVLKEVEHFVISNYELLNPSTWYA